MLFGTIKNKDDTNKITYPPRVVFIRHAIWLMNVQNTITALNNDLFFHKFIFVVNAYGEYCIGTVINIKLNIDIL